jgi:hypothetical protein
MARLEIVENESEMQIHVTLSRRNLYALLHKLDQPSSSRTIVNGDCHRNGCYEPAMFLVLHCEDDPEHYASRSEPPGPMSPDTENYVRKHGGWSPLRG